LGIAAITNQLDNMKHHRQIRVQKLQTKNRMVGKTFSCLNDNERRIFPWLGGSWFEKGKEEKLAKYLKEWEEETERLLKLNPNLKLI